MAKEIGIGVNKYANGDGTDETTKVQNALNAGAGKVVVFPYGYSFKVNGLSIPDNTTIYGYGAKLFNGSAGSVISSVGNGVKVYGLELQGQGNSTYNDNDRGFTVLGNWNGTVINYITDVLFEDCYFHDFGGYGAFLQYAKLIKFRNCKIQHIGYAGILGMSVQKVHVMNRTYIQDVSPGTGGNAYGVSFSRIGTSSDLTQYPRSTDCSVDNCTVEDVPLWEGLDTHGGENITFSNNTIRNCKHGVVLTENIVDATHQFAPKYCKAYGNTIYGINTGYGISVTGGTGSIGSPIDYAENCEVFHNTLIGCGIEGGAQYSGAIYARDTKGLVINGNTMKNSFINAISLYHDNIGFAIGNNTVTDVQSALIRHHPEYILKVNIIKELSAEITYTRLMALLIPMFQNEVFSLILRQIMT